MEDVSRDTYQDRLANFTTDTNRTPSINIYLINKIKVTSFYNTIRTARTLWAYIGTLTNLRIKTNLRSDLATTLLINLLDGTLVQPEAALHTYLDNSTGKSALFSWKTVTNLYDVLNLFLIMILWECSIDLQMDLGKTIFPFSTTRCNLRYIYHDGVTRK